MRQARTMLCAVAALALLVAPGVAAAQARVQGSPLTSPANYPHGCETRWAPGGPPSFEAYPVNVPGSSCTIFQNGTSPETTVLVPGTGTVLSARVKSGPNPAPLQISTIRRYFKPNQQGQMEYTCCHGVSQTPTFQPTPNAITEVPVNLMVSTQQPENGQTGWWDIVAVSAEGPGSLPIAEVGSHSAFAPGDALTTHWYFPKVAPSANNLNEWTAAGFEVLMNYTWCPGTAAAAASARAVAAQACPSSPPPLVEPPRNVDPPEPLPQDPPRTTTRRPAVRIAAGLLRLGRGGAVHVAVACRQATPCRGTVRLRTRGRRPALLARARVAVRAGRSKRVKLAIAPRRRAKLRRGRTKVRVEVALGAAGTVARDLVLVRR